MSRLFRSTPFLIGLGLAIAWAGLGALVIYIYGYSLLYNAAAIVCGYPDVKGAAFETCYQAMLSKQVKSGFWQSYVLNNCAWTVGPALLLLGAGAVVALVRRPKAG